MPEPIKRHTALQPLSRDHHFGLLLSWKIRQGLKKNVDGKRIKDYVQWFWQHQLKSHFEFEENHVFPILGKDDDMVQKALEDHEVIREMMTSDEQSDTHLDLLQEKLIKHIRFEERILFNKIENAATDKDFQELQDHDRENPQPDGWEDEFWV